MLSENPQSSPRGILHLPSKSFKHFVNLPFKASRFILYIHKDIKAKNSRIYVHADKLIVGFSSLLVRELVLKVLRTALQLGVDLQYPR